MPSRRRLAVVREGRALLYIPDPSRAIVSGRLEPAWLDVFYNPAMEFNRDFSVAVFKTLLKNIGGRSRIALDAHTGVGVRGIRYLLEAGFDEVLMNDLNPQASGLASLNARLNRIDPKRYAIYTRDANSLMHHLRLENPTPLAAIDVDPYGSPAPYIESALSLAGKGSLLAVTATDLAVLECSKRAAAVRRYQLASARRLSQSKEVGLRILLGFIARRAASLDKYIVPKVSMYAGHYYRLILEVGRGARRADRMLQESIGMAVYCTNNGVALLVRQGLEPPCGDGEVVGPLWVSGLGDPMVAAEVEETVSAMTWLETKNKLSQFSRTLRAEYEIGGDSLFYSLTSISSALRVNTPKKDRVIEFLRSRGYRAAPTHFAGDGISSDAPPGGVVEAVAAVARSSRA